MTVPFVHLRVRSEYSMKLAGTVRVASLPVAVRAASMRAVALTDAGNMSGAIQLYAACAATDVEPIFGCAVDVIPEGYLRGEPLHRLVLLAEGDDGFHNLLRIVSSAEGPEYPEAIQAVDMATLARHRKGIIGLTGGSDGFVAQQALAGLHQGRRAVGALSDCFENGRLFIELQDHGQSEHKKLTGMLLALARSANLDVVATNDCLFARADDAEAHLTLVSIRNKCSLRQTSAHSHATRQMYLKSGAQMLELFRHVPQAIKNTLAIAEMAAGSMNPTRPPMMPPVALPGGCSEHEYLARLARRGLEQRIALMHRQGEAPCQAAYEARFKLESDLIAKLGFDRYLIAVEDIVSFSKRNGIPVGSGRGSAAGSLVTYALGITDVDPIRHGLLFERFINPERTSMPDIDLDFCAASRPKVIEYLRHKYGASSVGQIVTFNRSGPQTIVEEVGIALEVPSDLVGRVASLLPKTSADGGTVPSIAEALVSVPMLSRLHDEDPTAHRLLSICCKLEHLPRYAGTHPSGVVLCDGALSQYVPVRRLNTPGCVTQYAKNDVESAGLVKVDILGLRTVTVLDVACKLIDKLPSTLRVALDLNTLPLDDPATFALLQSGRTNGIFQLGKAGMQQHFRKLKPTSFADIVAAIALHRPGPLRSGMVDDFIKRRRSGNVRYPHPCLEEILKPTYGVFVYQEQVMQAAQRMAGFTLGNADLLRRAIGTKSAEEMHEQRSRFLAGAILEGHGEAAAVRVFDLIALFAGYGFNKSHSAAYALIAYRMAYLKANFPVEFMCATLSADKDDKKKKSKLAETLAEAQRMGIIVLPPDINRSHLDFSLVCEAESVKDSGLYGSPAEGAIGGHKLGVSKLRFGLAGIAGIACSSVQTILDARRDEGGGVRWFADLHDVLDRIDLSKLGYAALRQLVGCGAFDSLLSQDGLDRDEALNVIKKRLDCAKAAKRKRAH